MLQGKPDPETNRKLKEGQLTQAEIIKALHYMPASRTKTAGCANVEMRYPTAGAKYIVVDKDDTRQKATRDNLLK